MLIGYIRVSKADGSQKVAELCAELGVTRLTLYRHVDARGELRPDGRKLLAR